MKDVRNITFSKGKKDNYLLPLYPAAAMMVGSLWDVGLQSEDGKRGFISGLLLLPLLFIAGFVLFLSGISQKSYPFLKAYHSLGLSILFYLLVGSFLSFLFWIKKRKWTSFLSLIITFALFHLHISYSLPLKLNPQRSMKGFSEMILKRMGPGDELKTIFSKYNGLLYYTRKPYIEEIEGRDRFIEVIHSSQRVFIVFQERELETIKKVLNIEMNPIERVRVGHWDLVLISNR